MPELPEVENIKRTLFRDLSLPQKVDSIVFLRKDLRFPIPIKSLKNLKGKILIDINRRGKYLLFQFTKEILLSHLGMSGYWRVEHNHFRDKKLLKHDHVIISFNSSLQLIYNDPRRFGFIDFIPQSDSINLNPFIAKLGMEPLDEFMDENYLNKLGKLSHKNIKTFIMDQHNLVGIGNIYASEILFESGVHPSAIASQLSISDWERITRETKKILHKAIKLGGSTIKDYKKSDGTSGSFQNFFKVYNRANQNCDSCGNKICHSIIQSRSTYWCEHCQPIKHLKM